MSIKYETCGTLGNNSNDVTCSIIAVKEWDKSDEIIGFGQFEDAIIALKSKTIQSVYIPGAYPQVRKFIFDEDLKIEEINLHRIPEIVLVGKEITVPKRINTLFYHPATSVFIDLLQINIDTLTPVSSNSQACISLIEYKENALALSNEACAKRYGLFIHRYLTSEVYMPFYLFTLKNFSGGKNHEENCHNN